MAEQNFVVKNSDLAINWGNDIPVLATPILLWWAEIVCQELTKDTLESNGLISVGLSHDSKHIAPSPLGAEIRITCNLKEFNKNKLVFKVAAYSGDNKIFEGFHSRGITTKKKMIDRLR